MSKLQLIGYLVTPELFRDCYQQFILARSPLPEAPGWQVKRLSGYWLAHHESLNVVAVCSAEGTPLGVLLGDPVGQMGLQRDDVILSNVSSANPDESVIENWLYSFGGRWACIILCDRFQRIYIDPLGSLGVVYKPEAESAASTTSLLGTWQLPLGVFPANRPMQCFPAGLTHDKSIQRLLPNHYLDLSSWRAVRHYPKEPVKYCKPDELDEIGSAIAQRIRSVVMGISSAGKVCLGLTSGYDSRMLLAASRGIKDDLLCVTFDYGTQTWMNRVDLHISKSIAKRFKLRHQVLPVPPEVSPEVSMDYWRRIGFAGGYGKARDFYEALRHLAVRTFLVGFGIDLTRSRFVGRIETQQAIDPVKLLAALEVEPYPDFIQHVQNWINGLPTSHLALIADLAWIELQCGCWESIHMYGCGLAQCVTPGTDREIIQNIMRVPPEIRKTGALCRAVIGAMWPELNQFPFHNFTGPRRWLERARRALSDPSRILAVCRRSNGKTQ